MNDCQNKRDKQVPLELDKLHVDIGGLREAIDELEKGLSPVLREPDPAAEMTSGDENPKCDLANTIATSRRRVAELAASIRELTNRVEV